MLIVLGPWYPENTAPKDLKTLPSLPVPPAVSGAPGAVFSSPQVQCFQVLRCSVFLGHQGPNTVSTILHVAGQWGVGGGYTLRVFPFLEEKNRWKLKSSITKSLFENTVGNPFFTFFKYLIKRSKKIEKCNYIALYYKTAFKSDFGPWEVPNLENMHFHFHPHRSREMVSPECRTFFFLNFQ